MHSAKRIPLTALLALIALSSVAPRPARALDAAPLRSLEPPYFSADVAVTMDSLTHAMVSVTITVPYSELSWNKVEGGYAAGAGFTVELDPARRDRLYGNSWEKRLLLKSYEATHSSRNNLVVQRAFDVPPGRYKVRLHVRDVSSEAVSQAEDDLQVEDLARLPVGFADLQLGVLDSAGAFVPIPTRVFGYNSVDLGAKVVAFDRRPGAWPRTVAFHWRTLDEGGDVDQQGDTTLTMAQPTQQVVLRTARGELFLGDYTLEVERIEGKSRWRATRTFEVEESGPPHGRDFTSILEALSYIAGSAEVDSLRKATPARQSDLWEQFWRRRDPTPDTPRNEFQVEFFRRLRYAASHFQGFGAGWRSDMGRVYIRYGPPDQVESHPATSATAAAEVWYYNQPYRRFVFADRDGFGRYVLVQPALE